MKKKFPLWRYHTDCPSLTLADAQLLQRQPYLSVAIGAKAVLSLLRYDSCEVSAILRPAQKKGKVIVSASGYLFILFPDIQRPPNVVLFSYIYGLLSIVRFYRSGTKAFGIFPSSLFAFHYSRAAGFAFPLTQAFCSIALGGFCAYLRLWGFTVQLICVFYSVFYTLLLQMPFASFIIKLDIGQSTQGNIVEK